MAEHYISDDEQVEAIKKWWQANGAGIITGIVIGLAVVLGWQYWRSYRAGQSEQASLHYDALTQAVTANKTDEARQQAGVLLEEYPSSTYAILAALMSAKLALEEGNNVAAIESLQWVLNNGHQDQLKDIAGLRLTRILLAENRLDDAEAQLKQVQDPNFTAEVEELRGDIYVARKDPAKARLAYEAALAGAGSTGSSSSLLQLKLDNLPPPGA